MSIFKIGNNSKIGTFEFKDNIKISDSNSDEGSMASIGDNIEIEDLRVSGNEQHTSESYKTKCIELRKTVLGELNAAISNLDNENEKKSLQALVIKMEQLPQNIKGQWFFDRALENLKEFATDLGAKVVAEIAMKYMGF